MTARSVRVLHVLVSRRVRGETQVLLYPHSRWRDPHSDRALMALPTTKFDTGTADADNISSRLMSILNGDIGLQNCAPPQCQRLGETRLKAISPTHGVPTKYHIVSVFARLPVASHGRAARQLRGEWLSLPSALALDDLSPTARAVFEHQKTDPWISSTAPPNSWSGSASDRAVTARLLAAREGDLEEYGLLIDEIKPMLQRRLQNASCTRTLSNRSHDVEDVFADMTVRVLENLESFDPTRGSALMWLWIIARNLAVSHLRHNGRMIALSPEKSETLADAEGDPGSLVAARDEVTDLQFRLERILSNATPEMKRVWAMRMQEHRPYKEIAKILKLPVGTIATWIRKIRVQMENETSCGL